MMHRRQFLRGAGSAALAIPMLQSLMAKNAHAAVAPKRLIILTHHHGRPEGAQGDDRWTPTAGVGALQAEMSKLLAPLASIRNDITTVGGIDNIVRHATGDPEGHLSTAKTIFTCRKVDGTAAQPHPSVDFLLGEALTPNAAVKSWVVPMSDGSDATWSDYNHPIKFYGPNAPAARTAYHPRNAIEDLFRDVVPSGPPPVPTLRDRFATRRVSMLNGVTAAFNALRSKVNAADRARLDQHADYIRSMETRFSLPPPTRPPNCAIPVESETADAPYSHQGKYTHILAPAHMDNVIEAFNCDVMRVAALDFWQWTNESFPTEVPNGGFTGDWHDYMHTGREAEFQLDRGAIFYAKMFVQLVEKLRAKIDIDDRPMLENTLVVWMSDMGYGVHHRVNDLPIVIAGMPSARTKVGQHTHQGRKTTGDFWGAVLAMFGVNDPQFGDKGTLGSLSPGTDYIDYCGFPGHIGDDTPLHTTPVIL